MECSAHILAQLYMYNFYHKLHISEILINRANIDIATDLCHFVIATKGIDFATLAQCWSTTWYASTIFNPKIDTYTLSTLGQHMNVGHAGPLFVLHAR